MTIATYTELVTELEAYLKRTDYTPRIPTFVALTEAKLNRLLDDPEMEVRATATGTGQYTPLPTDFKRMVGISVGGPYFNLEQVSGADIIGMDQTITGNPRYYAIVDGSITFAPINSAANMTLLYIRRIPPLTAAAPTNWLLTLAPDLYLYGCLMQANIYGWQDERVPGFKALYEEAIEELKRDGDNRRWGSAPLAPRLGRT
jgi:hypothetical protein